MARLKNMKVKAVALVDEGANRRKFFLIKSKMKGEYMDKDLALQIIKTASLDKQQLNDLLNTVNENDRDEISAFIDSQNNIELSKNNQEIEKLAEKISEKFSKGMQEQLDKLDECFKVLKSILDALVKGPKEGKYPYPYKEGKYPYPYKESVEKKEEDHEVSPEEFHEMSKKAFESILNLN